jgi:hypothetical protein
MVRRPTRHRLSGWLAYTLSKSERAYQGGLVGPSDWDQRHILNLVAGYRFRGPWTVGGRFHLNSGRPVVVEDRTPAELRRLPLFHQFDVRIERRYVFDRFLMDVYLELVNTTLQRQVVGYRQDRDVVERDSFRIVLPSLGLRGEF